MRLELKVVRGERDGDGDGWVEDGTPRQRRALRTVRGNEAAIAAGAARIAKYRPEALAYKVSKLNEQANADWERMDALRRTFMFDAETKTGRHVMVDPESLTVDAYPPEDGNGMIYEVTGELWDLNEGKAVGDFGREFVIRADGGVTVYHSGMVIEPDAQGEGIASEFNAHAIAWYRSLGVSKIGVTASGSNHQAPIYVEPNPNIPLDLARAIAASHSKSYNGGYTWGEQGFDFLPGAFAHTYPGVALTIMRANPAMLDVLRDWPNSTDDARSQFASLFEETLMRALPTSWFEDAAQRNLLADWFEDFDLAKREPTPWEINRLGQSMRFIDIDSEDDPDAIPRLTWTGKALMSRSTWQGEFDLSWLDNYPETKGRRAGSARGRLLAGVFLAALGDDYDDEEAPPFEAKVVTTFDRSGIRSALSTAAQFAAQQEARFVYGNEPRDGDNDGMVYDGTLRERPRMPHVPSVGGIGRPHAEVQAAARERRRREEERLRAVAENVIEPPDLTVSRTYENVPPHKYRERDPNRVRVTYPYESREPSPINTTEDARTVAKEAATVLPNPGLLDLLLGYAERYDELMGIDPTSTPTRHAMERLIGMAQTLLGMESASGTPLVTAVSVGDDAFAALVRLALLKPPTFGKAMRAGTKAALPRDGDGDGWVYDNTPRQRLAVPPPSRLARVAAAATEAGRAAVRASVPADTRYVLTSSKMDTTVVLQTDDVNELDRRAKELVRETGKRYGVWVDGKYRGAYSPSGIHLSGVAESDWEGGAAVVGAVPSVAALMLETEAPDKVQHQIGTPLDYRGKFGGLPERLFRTDPDQTLDARGNFSGSPTDLTAFLDYSVVGDQVYIWFLTTDRAHEGQGLAGSLVEELYARHPGKTIEWGELMDPGAEVLYKRFKASHPEQTGRGYVWGEWATGPPERPQALTATAARPFVGFDGPLARRLHTYDAQSRRDIDHAVRALAEGTLAEPPDPKHGPLAGLYTIPVGARSESSTSERLLIMPTDEGWKAVYYLPMHNYEQAERDIAGWRAAVARRTPSPQALGPQPLVDEYTDSELADAVNRAATRKGDFRPFRAQANESDWNWARSRVQVDPATAFAKKPGLDRSFPPEMMQTIIEATAEEVAAHPDLRDLIGTVTAGRWIGDTMSGWDTKNVLGVTVDGQNVTLNDLAFLNLMEAMKQGRTPVGLTLRPRTLPDLVRYTVAHEYGHVAAFSMSPDSTKELIRRIVHLGGGTYDPANPNQVRIESHKLDGLLSGYGATHPQEAFAEGWAEYRLSDAPRPMATVIGKFIEQHLGEVVAGPASEISTRQQMIQAVKAAGDDVARQAALIAKAAQDGWFDVIPGDWDEAMELWMMNAAAAGLRLDFGPLPAVIVWNLDGSGPGAGCTHTTPRPEEVSGGGRTQRKALPIDGDGDGFVYDNTARQRLAVSHRVALEAAPARDLTALTDEEFEAESSAFRREWFDNEDFRTPENRARSRAYKEERWRRSDIKWEAQQAAEAAQREVSKVTEEATGWKSRPFVSDGSAVQNLIAKRVRERFVYTDSTDHEHEVTIDTELAPEERDNFLVTMRGVLDKAPLVGPVTIRVPEIKSNLTFKKEPGVGGYVTNGSNVLYVNPRAVRQEAPLFDAASMRDNTNLDRTMLVGTLQYILTHEVGHVLDEQRQHTADTIDRRPGLARRENRFYSEQSAGLSMYGRTDAQEAYAEAYAHWTLRDQITDDDRAFMAERTHTAWGGEDGKTLVEETQADWFAAQDVAAAAYAARYNWAGDGVDPVPPTPRPRKKPEQGITVRTWADGRGN